jgi:hypothetical protein
MADASLFFIAGLTVLLVISLAAVVTMSPEDAVRTEPPVLNPPVAPPVVPTGRAAATVPAAAAASQPRRIADPAPRGDARAARPNGTDPGWVRGGPPWAPAPRPPGV